MAFSESGWFGTHSELGWLWLQEKLDAYKEQMETEFEKHAIKPGDAKWQHDVQIEFEEPEEDGGWDDGDEGDLSDDF